MASPRTTAPDLADITALARAALAEIPEFLRQHCGDVIIRVEEFPDAETEREMGLQTPFDILGLYQGIPISDKSVVDTPRQPDIVFLYRRPMLDYWCESGEELGHLVRHVLIHEIGHHFGLSDADMARLEDETG